jgi:TetR/AcrR family transcriptional regulator, regulator of cefoperazone and chloramphenicol sensitivity
MDGAPGAGTDTRSRILEAAGEVFVHSGFRKATIREICGKANVNVAAINYHFRDKETLYRATLNYLKTLTFQRYPLDSAADLSKPPEERLKSFVQSFVFRVFDQGQSSWFVKLVAREYIEPTGAFENLLAETIQPNFNLLSNIVGELLGGDRDDDRTRLCAAGILAQCLLFNHAKRLTLRLLRWETVQPGDAERIAAHVFDFSLNAIRGFSGTSVPPCTDKEEGEEK